MNHEFWYLSRAAGFTAYLLLFGSVALGITTSTRLGARIVRQNAIFDVHRFLSILALAFVLLHVYVLLGDGYFGYDVWQLSLPFVSPYRMWQVAVGSFALYALGLVVASFYVRRFIGYRAWRALHFITFALFAASMLHGIMAGSDTAQPWARAIYLLTGGVTLALIAYRLQYRIPRAEEARRLRIAAASATSIAALLMFTGTGLFWHGSATNGGSATAPAAVSFMPSFDTQLDGAYTYERDAGSRTVLTIDAMSSGDVVAKLHIELGQGGATVNRVQLRDPASGAMLCDGTLSTFQGDDASMTCNGAGPLAHVRLTMQAQFEPARDGTLTGALTGSMVRES